MTLLKRQSPQRRLKCRPKKENPPSGFPAGKGSSSSYFEWDRGASWRVYASSINLCSSLIKLQKKVKGLRGTACPFFRTGRQCWIPNLWRSSSRRRGSFPESEVRPRSPRTKVHFLVECPSSSGRCACF